MPSLVLPNLFGTSHFALGQRPNPYFLSPPDDSAAITSSSAVGHKNDGARLPPARFPFVSSDSKHYQRPADLRCAGSNSRKSASVKGGHSANLSCFPGPLKSRTDETSTVAVDCFADTTFRAIQNPLHVAAGDHRFYYLHPTVFPLRSFCATKQTHPHL